MISVVPKEVLRQGVSMHAMAVVLSEKTST